MNRKTLLTITFLISLLSVPAAKGSIRFVKGARTWIVDKSGTGDFYNIQEAIDAAEAGDSIRVLPGAFYEHVVMNKSLSLIGEDSSTCIIDGNGSGTVVTVNADSVHVSGFTVQGSAENEQGIFLNQSRGNTILGNFVSNNSYGVWLESSENNTIKDNFVNDNVYGIYLEYSGNNTIENNTVSGNNHRGLHLGFSDNNVISGNIIVNNIEGIYFESSSSNRLRNNMFMENTYSFGVSGSELGHFIHDMDTSNRIDNKPVYYWVNQRDKQVPTDAGYVAVVNSTSIIVKDLNLTDQEEGPMFAYTRNSVIENVSVSNARHGFRLVSCENVLVTGNTFARNAKGIRLDYCVNTTIAGNMIVTSHEGIWLDHSVSNVFVENMVAGNNRGMFVYYSAYNLVYHNNFLDNELQVYIAPAKILVSNEWDRNGEGNYWDDYVDTDDNEDGIGGTPYILDRDNRDNRPLMGLFSNFTVAFDESLLYVAVICNSTISNFQCDLTDNLISFNVTGPDESVGFSRLAIPQALLSGPYKVLVDGLPPLTVNEFSTPDSTEAFLYFTYEQSTHKVTIVPEYPSMLLLLLAVSSLTLAVECGHSYMRRKQP